MKKSYQEMSQHLQLQKFVSNPDGQKTTFFAATQNHHQTVRCISAEDEKKSFFKTQNYLKILLPHRIYKLNKKLSLFSHRIFGIVFLSKF